jgi:hypothetical protein
MPGEEPRETVGFVLLAPPCLVCEGSPKMPSHDGASRTALFVYSILGSRGRWFFESSVAGHAVASERREGDDEGG